MTLIRIFVNREHRLTEAVKKNSLIIKRNENIPQGNLRSRAKPPKTGAASRETL